MEHLQALESAIRAILERKPRALIAIDGMAASGKTTLAEALSRRFDSCAVLHMDDFTVPFEDRYPGYFEKTLSNADLARFDREVLSPLLRGEAAVYRPYVCHPEPGFLSSVTIAADCRVIIVEGAYCLHPALSDHYDLRVLSLIDEATQRARILARNGKAQLERFVSTWIPMENRHIRAHRLHEICDLTISQDQAT
ncbi:MAG: phosphoribulokinase [Clostridiales bacterium]|nr:phosphoribulokinase [Clostridiales bacterium]